MDALHLPVKRLVVKVSSVYVSGVLSLPADVDSIGVVLVSTVVAVMWIGKLVSVFQLSLTQLLLMVVSTGYGINR